MRLDQARLKSNRWNRFSLDDLFLRPVFQVEGEEHRAFEGRLVVGGRFDETHLAVEANRETHRRQRVEEQFAVAYFLGRADRRQDQIATYAEAALAGLDVKPLHFAQAGGKGANRDATRRLAIVFSIEEATARWRIGARQRSHFVVETLKGQVDAEPGRIVAEELADVVDGGRVVGGERS
jgi:hypothetical protein